MRPIFTVASAVALTIGAAVAGPDLRGTIDSSSETVGEVSLQFSWPACAELRRKFGYEVDPFTQRVGFHSGVDIGSIFGDKVRASRAGVVRAAERRGVYGLVVEVDHGAGFITRYAHLQAADVKAGDTVVEGQSIARIGSSGRSNGPHLHFELWKGDVVQDPLLFLKPDAKCGQPSGEPADTMAGDGIDGRKKVP